MSDEPQSDERIYFDEASDDWVKFLDDLAVNNDEPAKKSWPEEENEFEGNSIDYGDYLKGDTEYIGSRRAGYRY